LRSPKFGATTVNLCAEALKQVAWADRKGFHTVQLPEHHGSSDNYNPSPFVLGAAMAGVTSRLRIHPSAVLLPLHDPVRIAEDACMLDNISNGRLDLTIGIGYVPSEFEMFGVAIADRASLVEAKLEVLHRAFAGERFDYCGRKIHVTPPPVQRPGPRMFLGGSVIATARRAARLGDGYYPMEYRTEYVEEYHRCCAELGKSPGRVINSTGPRFIHVAEDPEAAWAKIAPHALHESNSYAAAAKTLGQISPFQQAEDAEALRATNTYLVLTPEECLKLARAQREAGRHLTLAPMIAGLSPALAWESLDLFAAKVIPQLLEDEVALGKRSSESGR
jgi:alkanesulfonate monooxygenase SsuD/methylene tetrahydromethanopterin reductase-like flavin-dependent oxidoreductase (luciferase family)